MIESNAQDNNLFLLHGAEIFDAVPDRVRLQAGELLFREGQSGDTMYVVLEGELEVTRRGRRIDTIPAGDIFGEMALVDDNPRSASISATSDCVLVPIDRANFASLIQQHPEFAVHVMRAMSVRLRRLMQEEVKRQRLEHELDIGRRIQLSLLPERSPSFEGWQFATHYRAARQIGGDFYDFIAQSNHPDQLNLVVADVTGKGVPAAIFMAVVRTMIRAESAYGRNPSRTLDRTNKLILSDNRTPLFLSAFFGRLNTSDGRLTYASAGHDPSFVLRHDSGSIETLEARGMVLGAYDFMQFEEKITTLNSGDALIAYTDGVTEARNADGEFFGDERLLAVLSTGHGCPANELVTLVTDAIHEFAGETPQADDLTIVVVKRL